MKQALIDFNIELFARDLSVGLDALHVYGLDLIGSAPSAIDQPNTVRLIFEGEVLPAECANGWWIVRPSFERQQHGFQRIIKVVGVEVVGKPHLALAA